ncbi:MAG: acetyl-CoA carboxylase biotin carboxyl carrier protein [Planctomycetota bacterium]|jgi:acetyl-CoA carboxylase biotin carboxyl carrier protein
MAAALSLLAEPMEDGKGWTLRAPGVGLVRGLPEVGKRLQAGMECGRLEILGVRHPLLVPAEIAGQVGKVVGAKQRLLPTAYGDALFTLQLQLESEGTQVASSNAASAEQGLVLRAPQAGRFYDSPDPDSPAFIQVGDTLEVGRTIGLLEVMKTFSPVKYSTADGLPTTAKVKTILVQDRTDVEDGSPLLELE